MRVYVNKENGLQSFFSIKSLICFCLSYMSSPVSECDSAFSFFFSLSAPFQALFIRMSKHPSCFRLTGDIPPDCMDGEGRRVLFRGSVAELCPLAPNNVNTMAAAAVAAGTLGFTGVQGEIVSDTA